MRKLLVAVACMLPVTAALACGPDFPQELLYDRKASLLDLPEGTFYFETAHLLPKPADRLRAVEQSPWDDAGNDRAKIDPPGLSADELDKVHAMRAADDDAAAAKAGAGLAPEVLDYTLGAIAFGRGDMKVAAAHFEQVLALAPPARARRGLWAQYMLGRALLGEGDTDGAVAAYDVVRERALAGVPDPLGLAVASLGEQARIAWHHGTVDEAVKLYAEQAAHGSMSGSVSLLFVARSLLAHREQLDKALDDPLSQRLLAAYMYTRSNEFAQDWPLAGTTTEDERAAAADASSDATAAGQGTPKTGSLDFNGFLQLVQAHGLDHFDGADRMAAGLYNVGHYDLAAKLAAKSTTPLAAWVRAKLALRAGDQATAMREYALAAKGFPVDEAWSDEMEGADDDVWHPLCRVETERGVLALGRGEYLDAMARMYAGAQEYWPDAAYVAERVLTVDELKGFVDGNVPASPKKRLPKQGEMPSSTPADQLRELLARRLLRVGRDDEALRYFDDPDLRKKAMALIAAKRASSAWSNIPRAQALFKQAQITRADGMELLGTELAPDNAEWSGSFPPRDLPSTKGRDFVGSGEAERVTASATLPDARYRYRYVAANLAEQAAALMPARSQAYAAMMCTATGWMLDTDGASAGRIYRRYLRNGAYVKWGKDFGTGCPAPDFETAKWLPYKQAWWQTRHWTRREWPFLLVGIMVVVGLFAMRRRRAKA
ncbi:MAG TPA: hypothetical protein VK753_02250 [Xanthomonadaceae bacterium]|nr:hypothetical protein [Xanthomonadaceae bacterium]